MNILALRNLREVIFGQTLNSNDELCISVISEFEFYCGCLDSQRRSEAEEFFQLFSRIDFDSQHCIAASKIYINLHSKNQLLDVMDILLAGVAGQEEMVVATLNKAHFERIEDLEILSL